MGLIRFASPAARSSSSTRGSTANPSFPLNYFVKRCDVILVTHAHFDHIHDVVPLSKEFSPQVVSIYETGLWLASKGVANTIGINKGGTVTVGPISVTMTHAVHSCGILDGDKIIYGGEAAGYIVRLAGSPRLYTAPATPTSFPTWR
jgi:L-ascorbate metabolism protein UlaG (beta-lactamase superfamily)